MIASAQSWIPRGALYDGVLLGHVANLADVWVKRWIAAPESASCEHMDAPALSGEVRWQTSCGALVLASQGGDDQAISARLLGIDLDRRKPNKSDVAIMQSLAVRCLQDLLHGLAQGFGASERVQAASSSAFAPPMRFALRAFGVSLSICVDQGAAADARKSLLPRSASVSPLLATKQNAIDLQRVEIGARLGHSTLAIADARALNLGDVLVLDRKRTDELEITINNGAKHDLGCTIGADADALNLRVTRRDTELAR